MPKTPDLIAALQPRLVELETEIARLAQERDAYKAWCDAETHHIAAVRRERAEAVAALAAVQPLIEAVQAFIEATEQHPINEVITRSGVAWGLRHNLKRALSSFPAAPGGAGRAAQPSAEASERHCPDHPLNTTSDGAGTLFCATFGCSWRLPVATPGHHHR